MSTSMFTPMFTATTSTAANVYVNTTTTNTAPGWFIGGATNGCGQVGQQAQAMQQQMAALQQSYQSPPLTIEAHEQALRAHGHVVLRKAHRVVHTKLLPPGPAAPGPLTFTAREVDGYALPAGKAEYVMPDGSILMTDEWGNYRVEDHEARVTYRANRQREWNPYVSASDLLEAFVAAVGKHPLVNQGNVLRLPIEAFVNWLIREAATRDGDNLDGLPKVEDALRLPAPTAGPVLASTPTG